MKPRRILSICLALLLVAACQKTESKLSEKINVGSNGSAVASGSGPANPHGAPNPHGGSNSRVGSGSAAKPFQTPPKDIDSKDILARTEVSKEVAVKHVLIAWAELITVYGQRMDTRATKRTNADAAKFAQEILGKLKADPKQVDALVKEHSEDPGMKSGDPYTVAEDAPFVPEFKNLALRLKLEETGIVKTRFGYHVMTRVSPPPPDPLESADILGRPANEGEAEILHILVGWKDLSTSEDERAKKRTKEDADKLAKELLGKVRGGADVGKLMKEHSEDPGSKDNARAYEVSKDAPYVDKFKKLALRLKVGESGLVKTEFGWHVMKRVPPDKLISTAILDRKTAVAKVKVKHILLGWDAANIGDPRAQKRTRAELEKLVKETLAKLAKGDKIEPIMKEISEHADSAATGKEFEITATTQGLPGSFRNLSLRLNKDEAGVVKSQFGIHVIQRVE